MYNNKKIKAYVPFIILNGFALVYLSLLIDIAMKTLADYNLLAEKLKNESSDQLMLCQLADLYITYVHGFWIMVVAVLFVNTILICLLREKIFSGRVAVQPCPCPTSDREAEKVDSDGQSDEN